jgi:8-amino-7-oxononanoate synthase
MSTTPDPRELARDMLTRHAPTRRAQSTLKRGLEGHPRIEEAKAARAGLQEAFAARGLPSPYFQPHEGVSGPTIRMLGQHMVNFGGYNYLGLAGHPAVIAAAKSAIDEYGTSASASRAVAGEIPLYAEFEGRLAGAYGVADAVTVPSGYLTNAAVIGFLLGPNDLAACDALAHSSVVSGTQWAQCRRAMFRHNDPESLDTLLTRMRGHAERVLVIVEGVYSMDGDIVALPDLIAVARKHDCLVMVDEAHSFGTLGSRGYGVREHYDLPGDSVDLWMGTLSKALASCGGFLAGGEDLIWALKLLAPGVSLYTAPATPSQIAAATAAFDVLQAEPERPARLRANAAALVSALQANGWNTGTSGGTPVVPIIIGERLKTLELSAALLQRGVNAGAITHPAVAQGEDRIRLFLSSEHTEDHIETLISALAQC